MPDENALDPKEPTNGEVEDASVPGDEDLREGQADEPDGEGSDEDEGEEGPDEVVDEPRRRPPGRAERRIENLRKSLDETRRQSEQRIAQLEQQIRQPQQRQESPEEESARMALMTPDERMDYRLNKSERIHREQLQAIAFQTAETTDQATFRSMIQANPSLQRYETEVEEVLASIRRKGLNLPRSEVLNNVVGKAALARMGKGGKQAERAKKNIDRQTTAPVNGRGDVQVNRRKGGDTARSRLAGQEI